MSQRHSEHRAHYDDEGNIVIDGEEVAERAAVSEAAFAEVGETLTGEWHVTGESVSMMQTVEREEVVSESMEMAARTGAVTAFIAEGSQQLRETGDDAALELQKFKREMRSVPSAVRTSFARFARLAREPILLPGKRKKPRSRMTLFAIDTVRFGSTFALIFGALFVSINYQSFWNIAKAQLALDSNATTMQALSHLTDDNGNRAIAATYTDNNPEFGGSILSYLPDVGPPEDRLIIPKIGKNVPIVRPPIDALISEDWSAFENDIQESLRSGVVHYPGTAKPGQAGNFFLTGHSSYYPWDSGLYKDIFARLHELEIGDTYSVYYGGDLHTYRITKKYEVKPSDVKVLDQPVDKRIATLMTCTPVGTTLRRLIVQSEEIDPATGIAMQVGEKTSKNTAPPVNMLPI